VPKTKVPKVRTVTTTAAQSVYIYIPKALLLTQVAICRIVFIPTLLVVVIARVARGQQEGLQYSRQQRYTRQQYCKRGIDLIILSIGVESL
jgi:hypothetical protein